MTDRSSTSEDIPTPNINFLELFATPCGEGAGEVFVGA